MSVTIELKLFDGTEGCFRELLAWMKCGGSYYRDARMFTFEDKTSLSGAKCFVSADTWVLKDGHGKFYPCPEKLLEFLRGLSKDNPNEVPAMVVFAEWAAYQKEEIFNGENRNSVTLVDTPQPSPDVLTVYTIVGLESSLGPTQYVNLKEKE